MAGARMGIPRMHFYSDLEPAEAKAMTEAIAVIEKLGGVVVDPADLPSVRVDEGEHSIRAWDLCAGPRNGKGNDSRCSVVLKYGMKRDFNAWLKTLGDSAPVKTLKELRQWNLAHRDEGTMRYGQDELDISDEMVVGADRARYLEDRARDIRLAGAEGIDAAMKQHRLDALLFPSLTGYDIAARPGYPTVIVPFAFIPNAPKTPFPDGFMPEPSPFGVSFTGMACSEPRLIALAYAFEQATKRRVPPELFP